MTVASTRAHLCFIQPGPGDVGIAIRAIDVVEKTEEDLVVGPKMRIRHHVEKADVLCTRRRQGSHSGYGVGDLAVGVQNA